MNTINAPLMRAVEAAGTQTALADAVNAYIRFHDLKIPLIRQAHIWSWLNRTGRVPAEYVIPVEKAVGGRVTRHDLRPDIYPLTDPEMPPVLAAV